MEEETGWNFNWSKLKEERKKEKRPREARGRTFLFDSDV
jgi:hypothetical protein